MMWQDWNGPAAPLRKREDLLAGIFRSREDVKRGKVRLAQIERAPLPVSHTKPLACTRLARSS